ncbi:MAG: hypothetical protein RIQ70_1222 [Bacteroidota bacterium]
MKTCGIPEIDTENKALLKEAKGVIRQKKNPKDILEKIYVFRMKLAYNKATESLESNFGWSKIYDDLIVKLKKTLKLKTKFVIVRDTTTIFHSACIAVYFSLNYGIRF